MERAPRETGRNARVAWRGRILPVLVALPQGTQRATGEFLCAPLCPLWCMSSVRPGPRLSIPAMFLQLGEQIFVQRPCVAGGNVLLDVLRLSHSRDGGAYGGMGENEAQWPFLEGHFGGEKLFSFFHPPDGLRQIFFTQKARPPIALRGAGFPRPLFPHAALVPRRTC